MSTLLHQKLEKLKTSLNSKTLCKSLCFSDLHMGRKQNSDMHNDDCLHYLDWLVDIVKSDPSIDHIVFMGDWHENRTALNLLTMAKSNQGIRKLNDLGLPIFVCVGNHDLHHRHTRAVHSLIFFDLLENVYLIDDATRVDFVGDGTLFAPFMFPEEYSTVLAKYLADTPVWYGHFEFKDFVITGYNTRMPTGPDANDFVGPKKIFSGHFHKRQKMMHIHYIGNTFPMDFGDAGDFDRGCVIYDYKKDRTDYREWEECPKYIRCKLTDILLGNVKLFDQARVRCVADEVITYEESTVLKQQMISQYNLREFVIEEPRTADKDILANGTGEDVAGDEFERVEDSLINMLLGIKTDTIDGNILVSIYTNLKVDE
jgi:DNA repair exonuclease SbcCD nuclease subunit